MAVTTTLAQTSVTTTLGSDGANTTINNATVAVSIEGGTVVVTELQGPAGPAGPEGPQGPAGPTGPQGPAGAGSSWGTISGTLAEQTDLNTALSGKQPLATVLTNTTASYTTALNTKLSGIATGATANSSDATLLARANHTGSQAISTVTGLQTALDAKAPLASPTFTGTVSGITKAMVGLANVDNTSDAAKPVSTAQQTALNLKANLASPTFTGTITAVTISASGNIGTTGIIGAGNFSGSSSGTNTGDETYSSITTKLAGGSGGGTTNFLRADGTFAAPSVPAGSVDWGNITGTLSSQTDLQSALNAKAPLASPTFTGTVSGITKSMVGLSNVDNTSDASKPVSTAQATAIGLKLDATHAGTGGTAHADVIAGGASGFMTGADKTKLNGIATGATANTGTVTSITLTQPAAGLTITSSGTAVTTTGTRTFALANDLAAVEGLATTGIVRRTATDTWTAGTAVALTELATQAGLTFVANSSGSTGTPQAISATSATEMLNVFTTSLKGLAPASGGGTTNFLRADGTWAAPPSGGGGGSWGAITGNLADQTDLQSALNAKAPLASPTFTGTLTSPNITSAAATTFALTGTAGINVATGTGEFAITPRAGGNTGASISSLSGTTAYLDFYQNSTYRGYFGYHQTVGLGMYSQATAYISSTSGTSIEVGSGVLFVGAVGRSSEIQIDSPNTFDSRTAFHMGGTWRGNVGWNASQAKLYLYSSTGVYVNAATGSTVQTAVNDVVKTTVDASGLTVAGTITANNHLTTLGGFCSGKPANGEIVAGCIAPVAFTVTQANCVAKATTAATASTVFTIKKDGTTVGTMTFAASGTVATVSISSGAITAGQHVYIEGPATADATLANISFLVRA